MLTGSSSGGTQKFLSSFLKKSLPERLQDFCDYPYDDDESRIACRPEHGWWQERLPLTIVHPKILTRRNVFPSENLGSYIRPWKPSWLFSSISRMPQIVVRLPTPARIEYFNYIEPRDRDFKRFVEYLTHQLCGVSGAKLAEIRQVIPISATQQV